MKKLTIKHLAAYLPYGLKGLFLGKKDIVTEMDNVYGSISSLNNGNVLLKDFKPILRPLSDLTKEIEDGKPMFFPSNSLMRRIRNKQDIFNCDYNEIDYLIRNHFDVFGLIEKGLAIDKNTLN